MVADGDAEAALDHIRNELACHRSSLLQAQKSGAALSERTRELCAELREAISASRRRVAELAQSAVAHERTRPGPGMIAAHRPDASGAMVKLRPGLPPARLRRVTEYIEANLGEAVKVRELAQLARMSPSHFTAMFRHSTGMSPYAYILRQRTARARELVIGESLSLAEISYRLGFSSQAHFTTAFRKRFGITPSACRARGPIAVAFALIFGGF